MEIHQEIRVITKDFLDEGIKTGIREKLVETISRSSDRAIDGIARLIEIELRMVLDAEKVTEVFEIRHYSAIEDLSIMRLDFKYWS